MVRVDTDYFSNRSDPRLFSYSAENRRATIAVHGGPGDAEPLFLAAPLAPPAAAGARTRCQALSPLDPDTAMKTKLAILEAEAMLRKL